MISDRSKTPPFTVGNVPGKGRGLIASKTIKQGSIILRDPAIKLEEGGREHINNTMIRTLYHFYKTEHATDFYVVFTYWDFVEQEVIFGRLPYIANAIMKFAKSNQIVLDQRSASLIDKKNSLSKIFIIFIPEIFESIKLWRVKEETQRVTVNTYNSGWASFKDIINYPLEKVHGNSLTM